MGHVQIQEYSTREKRGKGISRQFAVKNKLPRNCLDVLLDPTSKQGLFAFLSDKISHMNSLEDKELIVTFGAAAIHRGSDR